MDNIKKKNRIRQNEKEKERLQQFLQGPQPKAEGAGTVQQQEVRKDFKLKFN